MTDKKKAAPSGMPSGIGAHGFEKLKAHVPASGRDTSGDQLDPVLVKLEALEERVSFAQCDVNSPTEDSLLLVLEGLIDVVRAIRQETTR